MLAHGFPLTKTVAGVGANKNALQFAVGHGYPSSKLNWIEGHLLRLTTRSVKLRCLSKTVVWWFGSPYSPHRRACGVLAHSVGFFIQVVFIKYFSALIFKNRFNCPIGTNEVAQNPPVASFKTHPTSDYGRMNAQLIG